MKTLTRNLKQALDALEFSDANHLSALKVKLDTLESTAPATQIAGNDEPLAPLDHVAAATH